MKLNIDEKSEIISYCPECGAPSINGMNCWEQLGGIIAWEYDDPELLAEHFKTVACYNLQHPAKFLEKAIIGLKASFIEHLDKGLTPAEIRKLMGKAYQGNKRVLRDKKEINPVLHNWKMTIADVYIPDCPEGAADRVRKWAAAIRLDL